MKRLVVLFFLSSCAPISPSVPKSKLCDVPSEYQSRYNSVIIGDSWNDVQYKMGEAPEVNGDVQTYTHCKKLVFTFNVSVLATKEIK